MRRRHRADRAGAEDPEDRVKDRPRVRRGTPRALPVLLQKGSTSVHCSSVNSCRLMRDLLAGDFIGGMRYI